MLETLKSEQTEKVRCIWLQILLRSFTTIRAISFLFPPMWLFFSSGPGAAGCHPRSVHGGRRRCQRGHQPHSEITQEGGAIISWALLALEPRVTHNTPLVNFVAQCLMNIFWHCWNTLAAHVIRAMLGCAKHRVDKILPTVGNPARKCSVIQIKVI